jgi:hypothetical protein
MLDPVTARRPRETTVLVAMEAGAKRTFAAATDWPGWCRSGRGEEEALAALADYASRYRDVADMARLQLTSAPTYRVTDRVAGSATTDFGAPGIAVPADERALDAAAAERIAALVEASWTMLDRVVDGSPAELRKGPRGGGRDRDEIVDHVLAAEREYARKLGVRVPVPRLGQAREIAAMRDAIRAVLVGARKGVAPVDRGWLPRYAARRIAWHALDHAWEIEDRSDA